MKKEPLNRLSVKKVFQAMKLIEEHGAMAGDIFVYADGWDDARIATEIGCAEVAIAYRRKELFGKIRAKFIPKEDAAAAAFNDLRARVEVLERAVWALQPRPAVETPNGTHQEPAARLVPRFLTS